MVLGFHSCPYSVDQPAGMTFHWHLDSRGTSGQFLVYIVYICVCPHHEFHFKNQLILVYITYIVPHSLVPNTGYIIYYLSNITSISDIA